MVKMSRFASMVKNSVQKMRWALLPLGGGAFSTFAGACKPFLFPLQRYWSESGGSFGLDFSGTIQAENLHFLWKFIKASCVCVVWTFLVQVWKSRKAQHFRYTMMKTPPLGPNFYHQRHQDAGLLLLSVQCFRSL
jgi:hypothetical protein